jgi:hypothetical protein
MEKVTFTILSIVKVGGGNWSRRNKLFSANV